MNKQSILALTLALAAALGTAAHADTVPATPSTPHQGAWGLDISTTSYHTRQWARDSLNQDNPGLGIEYHCTANSGFAAGFYKNSYSRESFYATATYIPLHITLPAGFSVAAGGLVGAISGYTRAEAPDRPLMAAALLEIRSEQGYGVNLIGVPNAAQSAGFIGLQLVVPLA
ncbi:conserved exported hypothetical protein [Thiomonas sp. X19]|uniref:hypothetical protein n=1 Tax=Thiomonas sp. X19 TaxID=1050370 RepID=UPI000B6A3B10|nr:hypothetical protein [Thiomonas sp. X19]SCC94398.1 conserved exported hypothetical protein [Thiomonas sp. X19]